MGKNSVIIVKLSANASQNEVHGWMDGLDGNKWLKVSVTATPTRGEANKALLELLSKHFRKAKSAFAIVSGETSNIKRVEIQGGV